MFGGLGIFGYVMLGHRLGVLVHDNPHCSCLCVLLNSLFSSFVISASIHAECLIC